MVHAIHYLPQVNMCKRGGCICCFHRSFLSLEDLYTTIDISTIDSSESPKKTNPAE